MYVCVYLFIGLFCVQCHECTNGVIQSYLQVVITQALDAR